MKMKMLAFAVLLATACSELPKDPGGTLDRIRREKSFRVGIVSSPAPANGREQALLARVAAATGARPSIAHDTAERLLIRLREGELDLVLGEFERDGPWSLHVHMLPALERDTVAGRETVLGAAAASGENGWIMLLDREARVLGAEP
jgi:ABC-type amino acid transport substrate-binding protein